MADVASLGLSVDSGQVTKGARELDKLTGAASRAEAASKGLAGGSKSASAAAASVSSSASAAASALNAEAASAAKAAGAMRMHAAAVNDNARRMGGSMSGLAAQFQDIGVTAAMGMNPAIIALQQGTQIAGQMEMAMQSGASATSVLGTAFKSLFSPLTFITIALTALAAVGLQMVDWPALAAAALNALASVLQTIAPYAIGAAAALALLYAPAIIGGIVSVIALLGRLAVAAVIAAGAMAAANPALALVAGIAIAVAAANIFRDELTRIFGVDIVGAAKTGANYVIGSFVAAFEDLKFIWNQFPNIVGAAAVGAANAALQGIQAMLNAASGMLDAFIDKVNGALNMLPGGFNIGKIGQFDLGQIANPYSDALSGAVGDRNAAVQRALSADYIGGAMTAISNGASSAAEKLRELATGFVGVGAAAEGAGGKAKGAADTAKDAWEGLREATTKAAEAMKSAWDEAGNSAGGILRGLIDKTMSWKDALLAAIPVVLKLLNSMNLAKGGAGLFGGGFFQSLMQGFFGFAKGGYTGNAPANAAAGVVHGREYVFSARATARIGKGNLDAMHNAAKGYAGGGYVTPNIPRLQAPSNANQSAPQVVEVRGVFVDDNGVIKARVDGMGRQAAQAGASMAVKQVKGAMPAMLADTQARTL